jgi:drug/metabolite transporter (DMT)-like permease
MGEAGGLRWPVSADWGWLIMLAWVCTVGAYLGYIDALTRVSMFTVNVIYNMEPVYGIVLALLFFGESEKMSPGFYLGAGIILAVVLVMPFAERWKRPKLVA